MRADRDGTTATHKTSVQQIKFKPFVKKAESIKPRTGTRAGNRVQADISNGESVPDLNTSSFLIKQSFDDLNDDSRDYSRNSPFVPGATLESLGSAEKGQGSRKSLTSKRSNHSRKAS